MARALQFRAAKLRRESEEIKMRFVKKMRMSAMVAGSVLALGEFALAEQPLSDEAKAAFSSAPCVREQASSLGAQGYFERGTQLTLLNAEPGDEGINGFYLASAYFETVAL